MKPERTLVIGDIHGNYEALNRGLDAVEFDLTKDRIICVGDYVDGWDDSFEVVQMLLEIKNSSKFENIFLLGNHDKWFLDILVNDFENLRDENYLAANYRDWFTQGGKQTLESYLMQEESSVKIHLDSFFKKLKYYHIENNKLFVHAGFDQKIGFKSTLASKPRELIWNRSLFYDAYNQYLRNENLREMNEDPVDFKYDDFDKIYIGHTPTILYELKKPVKMGNVINVDQGCKKNGLLTIWIDETDEFFICKP